MIQIYVFLTLLVFLPSQLDAACSTGWKLYQKHCYKKFDAAKSWDNALMACVGQDAKLAEVENEGENTFIKNAIGGNAWIGISRCHTSSTCYLDFSPALYRNWALGQPDKRPQIPPGLENKDFAVFVRGNGIWLDNPKQEFRAYICKKTEDPCEDNFCNPDHSKCKDGKCVCNAGWSGEYCYVGPCDVNPCKNEGTCKLAAGGYQCTCVNFYYGKNCEVPPPCETKKPCQHGTCENLNNGNYKCNCEEGWHSPRCEKEGSSGGDPHYSTFDRKRYDFMGKCEYIYAKDCSENQTFEILQQNEACGRGTVSCTKSIRIFFKTFEVGMQRSRVVYVNGERVELPWKNSSATIARYGSGGAFLSVPELAFSVRWDGGAGVLVKISQRYKGIMCGLLGNADGNPNNDFQLPDKTITTDIAKFGNSWKKNPKCVNGVVPPDPCKALTPAQLNNVKTKCGIMKKAPFQKCNSKIAPDVSHIPNCEYDLCAMIVRNPSAAWCQALETYDRACNEQEINIDWEGKPGFKECDDPCANLPCFNGAECKKINGKEFTCTCPKGFTGPTCKDVLCRAGYLARGDNCYTEMSRRPWQVARCTGGDQFVSPANVDENEFIYKKFVEPSGKNFWMNARVCGPQKLCRNDFGASYFHNFAGDFPEVGCVQMPSLRRGMWFAINNCRIPAPYICKYEKF